MVPIKFMVFFSLPLDEKKKNKMNTSGVMILTNQKKKKKRVYRHIKNMNEIKTNEDETVVVR